jgi:thiamine biosynthesis lipoprotein
MESRLQTLHASPEFSGGAFCVGPVGVQRSPLQVLRVALILLGIVLGPGLTGGCGRPSGGASSGGAGELRLEGSAMGTTWSAILVPGEGALPAHEDLRARIRASIESVEGPLSTWRPDSEISRFNGLSAGESLAIGAEFRRCLETSEVVHSASGGAFDPTVGPLVEAYGFDAHEVEVEPPSEAELERSRARVGWRRLMSAQVGVGPTLSQPDPPVELDLSAVAKGRAVDAVHADLLELGLTGLFFELGGEVRVAGASPRGDRWRVGVERPAEDPTAARILELPIELREGAVATSGFGRNQRRVDGQWIAHTFDPRTGRPAPRQIGSATVLAPACDLADALATALCVLDPRAGLELIERFEQVEAVLLIEAADGAWQARFTSGLEREGNGPLRLTRE